uniref:DUF4283 domain-containing protein n=1 Tax=Setaria digitata TaxID=48799 RepID=A0A915PV32_9BILA
MIIELAKLFGKLTIFHMEMKDSPNQPIIIDNELETLHALKLININATFTDNIPEWINYIERIHIEKASLTTVPFWLIYSSKLTRIFFRETAIDNLMLIAKLRALRSLKVTKSMIGSLEKVEILGDAIQEIDLSNNQEPGGEMAERSKALV